MAMDDSILAAAQMIALARRNRSPLKALPPDLAPGDEAAGYRIQRAVHDLLLPYTGPLVGYKIGCTSPVMQRYLDIPHPCGGGVFAKDVHQSGASLSANDFVRIGVECEIAVRLGRDLAPSQAPFTADAVALAVEAYLPAVVGRALINGAEVGQGTGADVLGHPHNALAWLANHLASEDKSLRAGQIVLTGSLVKTVWLNAGDKVVMELAGLGKVAVTFT